MDIRLRRGIATPLVFAVILAGAALAGAVYYATQRAGVPADAIPEVRPTSSAPVGTPMTGEPAGSGRVGRFSPSGTTIAGVASPLVDFNKADYDRALAENRVILLYFYANWCPICRVEVSRGLEPAFNELNDPRIVGFRVNYNDNQTDDDEEALARKFGIAYQHTKVILKNGQQVLKNGETWDKERYLVELGRAAQ